jgi:hypothetical protein
MWTVIGGDVQQKRKSGPQSQAPIHFQKLSDASSKIEIVVFLSASVWKPAGLY